MKFSLEGITAILALASLSMTALTHASNDALLLNSETLMLPAHPEELIEPRARVDELVQSALQGVSEARERLSGGLQSSEAQTHGLRGEGTSSSPGSELNSNNLLSLSGHPDALLPPSAHLELPTEALSSSALVESSSREVQQVRQGSALTPYEIRKMRTTWGRKMRNEFEKAMNPTEPTSVQLKWRKYDKTRREKAKAEQEAFVLLNPDAPILLTPKQIYLRQRRASIKQRKAEEKVERQAGLGGEGKETKEPDSASADLQSQAARLPLPSNLGHGSGAPSEAASTRDSSSWGVPRLPHSTWSQGSAARLAVPTADPSEHAAAANRDAHLSISEVQLPQNTFEEMRSNPPIRARCKECRIRKKEMKNGQRRMMRALEKEIYTREPTPSQLKQRKYNSNHRRKVVAEDEEARLRGSGESQSLTKLQFEKEYRKNWHTRKRETETPEQAEQRKARRREYYKDYVARSEEKVQQAVREKASLGSSINASAQLHLSSDPTPTAPMQVSEHAVQQHSSPFPISEPPGDTRIISTGPFVGDASELAAASHDYELFKRG